MRVLVRFVRFGCGSIPISKIVLFAFVIVDTIVVISKSVTNTMLKSLATLRVFN